MANNDFLQHNHVDEQQHLSPPHGYLVDERPIITQKAFNEVFIPTTYEDQTPVILFKQFRHYLTGKCVPSIKCGKSYVNTIFPFLSWARKYERGWLPSDIICGLTVAIMQIPQGMAYALLANLPAVLGLYISFFPPLVYAFFGTSRHLSLGAIAVVSLMTGNVVDRLSSIHRPVTTNGLYDNSTIPTAIINDPSYAITVATTLALTVGVLQVILSICRLGLVTAFLSDAFISGYTTGTAVLVFTSQISDIFGLTIKRYVGPMNITYIDIFKNLKNTNPATFIVSLCSIVSLILVKEFIDPFYKRQLKRLKMFKNLQIPIPIELAVIIVGTVVSHMAELNPRYRVKIVKKIDSGFPIPRVPNITLLPLVIKDAVIIAIVSFAISVSLATTIAKRFKYVVDGNQELMAYGLCSAVGSFFSCFPSAASLSRTSVYVNAGGKTQLASLISSGFLLIIILKIGPFFQPLPKACLAAIIVVALKGLFLQTKDIWTIGRITKLESIVWIITFLSTVLLDIDLGLIIGILVSLVIVIIRQFRPRTTILGQFARTEVYKNTKRYSNVHEISNIKIFRFESSISYFNADYFRSSLLDTIGVDLTKNRQHEHKNIDTLIANSYRLTYVIIDCSSINHIDYTGAKIFIQTLKDLNDVELKVHLCNMRYYIYELLERLKMSETCNVVLTATVHDAVRNIKEKMLENDAQLNVVLDRYSLPDGISKTSSISSMYRVYTVEQSDLVNTDVERSVDLISHLPKYTIVITVENRGSKPVRTYEYYVESQYGNNVAYVGASAKAQDDEDKLPFTVKKGTSTDKSKGNLYVIEFPNDIKPGKKFTFEVEVVHVHALKPYPTEIVQGERQLIQYKMNVYYNTKYPTVTQKTIITLPTDRAESYAQLPKPVNKNDQTITYGSYENIPNFSNQEITLHYENNNPFLTISNLNRWIEVSHWGNIAIEETIDMYHSGAKLKGPFSRLDFQRRQDSYSAVKAFKTSLPAAARDIYYRDEIGNISTSHVREMSDQVEVEIRPRFPLYGGWKTYYILGYNVPSYQYLFNKGNNYVLKMRLVDHVYDDQLLEQVFIRIVLPEGASNIEFYPPSYDVQRLPDEKHYTYLDTSGRPVVVLQKKNVLFNHIQDFEVHYTFEKYLLFREPLLIVGALFCLFFAVTMLTRLNFSITKNGGNESRLRLQAIWDQVIDLNSKRSHLYQKFDDALTTLKTSKDIRGSNETRKKIENELKSISQDLNLLALKAKNDSIDGSEKIAELQRIDAQVRELHQTLSGHAEKLVANKQTKQVYSENESGIRSKMREFNSRVSAIINQY